MKIKTSYPFQLFCLLLGLLGLLTSGLVATVASQNNFVAHIIDVRISPDGNFVAIGLSEDGTQVWDLQTNQILLDIPRGTGYIQWSPDSNRLATTWEWHTIEVWNIGLTDHSVGQLLSSIDTQSPPYQGGILRGISWSPAGDWLIVSGETDAAGESKSSRS